MNGGDSTFERDSIYRLASGGDLDAYVWLLAFHVWAHRLDDFMDEGPPPRDQVFDLAADAVPLFSGAWYSRHAGTLGPVLAVVADQYRASHDLDLPITLREGLRLAGNQVVLAVAYLCGGRPLVRQVADRLWPWVVRSQLEDENDAELGHVTGAAVHPDAPTSPGDVPCGGERVEGCGRPGDSKSQQRPRNAEEGDW